LLVAVQGQVLLDAVVVTLPLAAGAVTLAALLDNVNVHEGGGGGSVG